MIPKFFLVYLILEIIVSKRYPILIFAFFIHLNTYAQKENNIWCLGYNMEFNFNKSPAEISVYQNSNPNLYSDYTCSSISDSLGNLLFYTDGITVFNRYHDTMKNGNNLFGNLFTRGQIILKKPGTKNIYYIFTSGMPNTYGLARDASYSIVDMSLDSGRGKIVSKNTLLTKNYGNILTAVLHNNKRDFWICLPPSNNDSMFVFKLTQNGLDKTIKKFKTRIKNSNSNLFTSIQPSPNGKLLAYSTYNISDNKNSFILLNFNNKNGIINERAFIDSLDGSLIKEFSPNNQFLYLVRNQNNIGKSKIYQCEISLLKPYNIIDSIGFEITAKKNEVYRISDFELAPDNKIYISLGNGTQSQDTLAEIEFPNNKGISCNYIHKAHYLLGNHCGSLMNTIYTKNFQPQLIIKDSICSNDTVYCELINTFSDSVKWDFDDGNTITNKQIYSIKHKYKDTGDFLIKAYTYTLFTNDTFTQLIHINDIIKPALGNDTIICSSDTLNINLNTKYSNVLWNDSTTSKIKSLNQTGIYWVRAMENKCYSYDTIRIKTFDCKIKTKNFCIGDTTIFNINNIGADSLIWNFGDGKIDHLNQSLIFHIYKNAEAYQVEIKAFIDHLSITLKDSINILHKVENYLGDDTIICRNMLFTPPSNISYGAYKWNTGDSTYAIQILKSGVYKLQIKQNECISNDSIKITAEDCNCNVYFPSSFSPDFNSINDEFTGITNCDLIDCSLKIFNRWGGLIYESNNNTISWNGKDSKGFIVPQGVYVWIVKYRAVNTNNSQTKKGTITVIW